ncbi:TMEM43 family protein [Methylobacterium terricola]|nr:TMEM43 family protein [Methylobacterium terricola]
MTHETGASEGEELPPDTELREDDHEVAAPQGLAERLSDSVGSMILGLVLVPLACIGLFWNEGRAVRVARSLAEAGSVVRTVPTDRRDPSLDGTLVHLAGPATTAAGAADDELGQRSRGLALARKVEMYQWRESEQGAGADRKFTYRREWSEQPVPSAGFRVPGHDNPALPVRSRRFGAADARVEAVPVGAEATRLLPAPGLLPADDTGATALRQALGRPVRASAGVYHVGLAPEAPRVGDLRITYTQAPEGPASFLGRQGADGLTPYRARAGEGVLLAAAGLHPAEALVAKGETENRVQTWLLRAFGLIVLFLGFTGLFAPVNVLARTVPVLGAIVSGAITVVALAATALVGPTVIGAAWIAYRPLLAGGLVAGAVVVALLLYGLRRTRSAGPARPMPA